MRAAPMCVVCGLLVSGCLLFSTERQIDYGLAHYKMGLYDRAVAPLTSAANSLEKTTPPDPRLVEVLLALGHMADVDDQKDLARDFYGRALRAAEALQPADDTRLRNALSEGGNFAMNDGRPGDAIPDLERAERISATRDEPILHAIDLDNLGVAYSKLGQDDRARAYSSRALETIAPVTSGEDLLQTRGVILFNLGYYDFDQARYADAEAHYKEALQTLQSAPPGEVEAWRVRCVRQRYAELLRKTGRPEEAKAIEKPEEGSGR